MNIQDCKAFVAGACYGMLCGMNERDADCTLEQWKEEGVDIPEGLTAELFVKLWNDICNEFIEKYNA